MNTVLVFLTIVFASMLVVVLYLYLKKSSEYNRLHLRYKHIINIDQAKDLLTKKYKQMIEAYNLKRNELIENIKKLKLNYDVYSGPNLPPIPVETCHLFRVKVATHSG